MIREALEKDLPVVDNLLTLLIQDERKYNKNINPDFKVDNWYQRFINDDNRIILVYEIDSKIVGYIYGYIESSPVNLRPEAFLDALYVEEDYRGNGIATELIDELLTRVKMKDAISIEVGVLLENHKSVNLYLKKKFKRYSERLKLML